jgi:hypothetical protein
MIMISVILSEAKRSRRTPSDHEWGPCIAKRYATGFLDSASLRSE